MIQYFILSIIQGVTEFIPVSSSGHLVLLHKFFGASDAPISFDILLHLATALSLAVFLRKEIFNILKDLICALRDISGKAEIGQVWRKYDNLRLFGVICIAFLFTAAIALPLKNLAEEAFNSLKLTGIGFLITAFALFLTRRRDFKRQLKDLTPLDAIIVGAVQGIAVFPGISRSGLTISAGLLRGMDNNSAARVSFLISLPTILAAAAYKFKSGPDFTGYDLKLLIPSFLIAFLCGYFALIVLSRLINKGRLYRFSYYCVLLGVLTVVLSFTKQF
ncbi:MAG: undecaprenyl-diphosphate phosphatase [Candidatus Omnitrophota bacterium]